LDEQALGTQHKEPDPGEGLDLLDQLRARPPCLPLLASPPILFDIPGDEEDVPLPLASFMQYLDPHEVVASRITLGLSSVFGSLRDLKNLPPFCYLQCFLKLGLVKGLPDPAPKYLF